VHQDIPGGMQFEPSVSLRPVEIDVVKNTETCKTIAVMTAIQQQSQAALPASCWLNRFF
jgi:hypothetical protein